jgi:molecular chaperone DnaK (HSP70)
VCVQVRLSSARAARVLVPSLLPHRDLNVSVTQKVFELRCAKLFERLAVPVRQVRSSLKLFE